VLGQPLEGSGDLEELFSDVGEVGAFGGRADACGMSQVVIGAPLDFHIHGVTYTDDFNSDAKG
jgi:hypothetical protein